MSPEQFAMKAWVNGPLTYALKTADSTFVNRLRFMMSGSSARIEIEFDDKVTKSIDATGMDEREILKRVAEVI